MALLNPAATLPSTSRDAQELFDERFNAAQMLATGQTWVDELGESYTAAALETKYPLSILALKFREAKTLEGGFETIGEKDCTLTVAEYQAGVEIELAKIRSNAFAVKRWTDAAQSMVAAEQQFKLKLIADALVANTAGACGWDDLALFHDSHLSNAKDSDSTTFDNLQASVKDVVSLTNLEAEITLMANGVLDVNGDLLGVMPTHIGVPPAKFQGLKNLLKQDFVPSAAGTATMRNPYNDAGLTVVCMNQLTDADDWYLFDMNLISKGVPPWVVAKFDGGSEFGIRHWDMSNSDACRKKSTLAVSYHLLYGYKFLFPHAVRKVAGA
ncbi:MAG: hypothetical protein A3E78_14515 [Alphaproteobacteria bacterium RIFCSPHIGHO2_12_FULL_63_12]|nr:MAG: hypothetical protein A3E78_14515 [Alphaproteobacteria bacterium RIFCSPHIGHO2_12_FULL_63_12]